MKKNKSLNRIFDLGSYWRHKKSEWINPFTLFVMRQKQARMGCRKKSGSIATHGRQAIRVEDLAPPGQISLGRAKRV